MNNLVNLEGYVKQVALAEEIRKSKMPSLESLKKTLEEAPKGTQYDANIAIALAAVAAAIDEQSASYWIDAKNREFNPTWLKSQVKKSSSFQKN